MSSLSRYFVDEDHPNATPVITLELLSRSGTISHTIQTQDEKSGREMELQRPTLILDSNSGVHFLTDDQASCLFSPKLEPNPVDTDETDDMLTLSPPRSKQELLEYLIRGDGSVVCKICGEILQSRTHWYRHKYKLHVTPNASPAPLFRCEQCGIFFKSRKGYIGHLASRHENELNIQSELWFSEPIDSLVENRTSMATENNITIKEEPVDAEMSIPACEVPNRNFNNTAMPNIVMNTQSVIKNEGRIKHKSSKGNDSEVGGIEWEKQRRREERLVADIIARVKKECEESGQQTAGRRGYTRRSALTNG